jgi:hypothetical protein
MARRPRPRHGYYAKLTAREQRFVDEYLIDLNAYAAARRAGLSADNIHHLLNRGDVQAAIRERRELLEGERSNQFSAARFVLNKLWDITTADPRELVEVRRVPCRYCWGINGQYQFTNTEMDRIVKAYEYGRAGHPYDALWPRGAAESASYTAGKNNLSFDRQGGEGYTTNRDPNAACSECGGSGVTLHFIADTRKLGPQARQLYRGIKFGRNGEIIEVLMADQDHARAMLAKHFGVAVERKQIALRIMDPKKLSDDELTQAIAELEILIEEQQQVSQETTPLRLTRPTE